MYSSQCSSPPSVQSCPRACADAKLISKSITSSATRAEEVMRATLSRTPPFRRPLLTRLLPQSHSPPVQLGRILAYPDAIRITLATRALSVVSFVERSDL